MNCWAMRTSRDTDEHRQFLLKELREGRLRQGWGHYESQDLNILHNLWEKGDELSYEQNEAGRHWRMWNGVGEDYMQVGDLVAIPNMPEDGLFTICRVVGDYHFNIAEQFNDFGHIRPVEVLTPGGVSNNHDLVDAGLRRSFRCRSRMWNIKIYSECLNEILNCGLKPQDLACGSRPEDRVESVVAELITEPLNLMANRLGETLPLSVRAEEWEPVLRSALEYLFPVSVHHTGGSNERGADIEIVIPNPFVENRDWIVPVQVKDFEGEVGINVADQLQEAFNSRSEKYQVIAVVLLAFNAKAHDDLKFRMDELSKEYRVPFIFGGHELFTQLLARGYLRKS